MENDVLKKIIEVVEGYQKMIHAHKSHEELLMQTTAMIISVIGMCAGALAMHKGNEQDGR